MNRLAMTLMSLSLLASACSHASQTRSEASPQMLSVNETRMVTPALEKYTQDRLLGEVWKRPASRPGTAASSRSPRSSRATRRSRCPTTSTSRSTTASSRARSPRSSRISRSTPAGRMPCRRSRSRKTSLPSARSAADQLPPASAPLLPLDEAAEAQRASRVGEQFGTVAPGVVQYTTDVLFRDLWLRPDLAPRDRSLVTVSALIASGQVAQIALPPQPGDGQRTHAGAGRGGDHAPGLLRRLAQRLLGAAGRKGRLREASQMILNRENRNGDARQKLQRVPR